MNNNIKLLQGGQGGGFLEKSSPGLRLERLFSNHNREDILYFLQTTDEEDLNALYLYSDKVRQKYLGDRVYLRAIIEFSNYCDRECLYCGLHRSNKNIYRYRMSPIEIITFANRAYELGYKTVVLQSGDSGYYTQEEFITIIREIKKNPGLAVTLSIGEKSEQEYRAYFEAGVDRFLLKHETSDPLLFKRLKPGRNLAVRLECLRILKKIGYQTGSGIMIGLPGQTLESIAADIMLFSELKVDMIGCGPFIPHPGTILSGDKAGCVELTYRVTALNRLVIPMAHLPATTALSCLGGDRVRELALQRGANVIMPNLTPERYRKHYDIYPNKRRLEIADTNFRQELELMVKRLGRHLY